MEEMTRKQPDVDKVTKTYKRRAADPSSIQSHIPVLDKGRAGSKPWPISLKWRCLSKEVGFLSFWFTIGNFRAIGDFYMSARSQKVFLKEYVGLSFVATYLKIKKKIHPGLYM